MAFQVRIEARPTYLHFIVTGDNGPDSVAGYMEQVLRECTARQCFRVLIEERLEGPRLGTLQVFGLVTKGSERFRGVLQAMAYVDVNATGDLMGFAENVAVNRAVPVRVFASVAAAEEWLREAQPRSATAAVERADKRR
ncbi:MAG TPA: hypothetical protein VFO23_11990 [Steroidobacteraceae bacterium]|nr:hypothetical protein [Steroidobacteraceae bacterium]